MAEPTHRDREIFTAAFDIDEPSERAAFVAAETRVAELKCNDNMAAPLRARPPPDV